MHAPPSPAGRQRTPAWGPQCVHPASGGVGAVCPSLSQHTEVSLDSECSPLPLLQTSCPCRSSPAQSSPGPQPLLSTGIIHTHLGLLSLQPAALFLPSLCPCSLRLPRPGRVAWKEAHQLPLSPNHHCYLPHYFKTLSHAVVWPVLGRAGGMKGAGTGISWSGGFLQGTCPRPQSWHQTKLRTSTLNSAADLSKPWAPPGQDPRHYSGQGLAGDPHSPGQAINQAPSNWKDSPARGP